MNISCEERKLSLATSVCRVEGINSPGNPGLPVSSRLLASTATRWYRVLPKRDNTVVAILRLVSEVISTSLFIRGGSGATHTHTHTRVAEGRRVCRYEPPNDEGVGCSLKGCCYRHNDLLFYLTLLEGLFHTQSASSTLPVRFLRERFQVFAVFRHEMFRFAPGSREISPRF